MPKSLNYLKNILIISLFLMPTFTCASDDEDSTEVVINQINQVLPEDQTAFDDDLAEISPNPLLQSTANLEEGSSSEEDDLVNEQGYVIFKDEEDSPKDNDWTFDVNHDFTPPPPDGDDLDDKKISEMEDKLKEMTDALEQLIAFTNNTLTGGPQDPMLAKYWTQIQKLKGTPAYDKAMQELENLKNMHRGSGEAADIRMYLDWLCKLPWNQSDKIFIDLKKAREVLDREHSGLDKIKERIIEYLAVRERVPDGNPPILCFVGPPGVGKTTLGKAIAEATGRKFIRMPLGGISDEAKIRGFMRTYVSSKPGEILKKMMDVQSNNPLMLLDEIDKMGESNRGDPAAALLEVLDRAQNNEFLDHYIDIPFDLSKVMFIATANSYSIPGPLRDRMEIVDLSSYTLSEKFAIAKNNLLPKVMKENGLSDSEFQITDDALVHLISHYTAEAGVRNLERCIGSLCRKTVAKVAQGNIQSVIFKPETVGEYLGKPRVRPTAAFKEHKVGSTQGLAWTSVGGALLPIEARVVPGSGQIIATGSLGDVMTESTKVARSVVKGLMSDYGLKAEDLKDKDIHVHAPEAAVKKDGPSAGVTITTSLISALTGTPVRKDIAMTGEINLNGEVMAIGGLKEKLIAAHSAGIKLATIPKDNEVDLEDVPEEVKKDLKIVPVSHVKEVLELALVK